VSAQEYITSGLLEAYVYGILPEAEAAEVARAMVQYPEVRDEVAAIEAAMFQLATAGAVTPPAPLKENIWQAINASHSVVAPSPIAAQQSVTENTIPLNGKSAPRISWQLAAAFVALIGSLGTNFYLLNNRNQTGQQIIALQQRIDTLSNAQQNLSLQVSRYRNEADMISDPDLKPVVMQSTQKDHPMAATLYWSKTRGEAYVSVQKLPMPPEGMQYQLWAIADGKPVDLGVLTNEMIGKQGMEKVSKAVADGQAFAISLEKAGGSPVPSMDKIYVMGKVI